MKLSRLNVKGTFQIVRKKRVYDEFRSCDLKPHLGQCLQILQVCKFEVNLDPIHEVKNLKKLQSNDA